MKSIATLTRPHHPAGLSLFQALLALACLLGAGSRPAAAQCGTSVTGRFGGETSAICRVNADTLLVARGTELELYNVNATPGAPAPFSPPRRVSLEAPAVKIAMAQGSSRAYVLLRDGSVKAISMFYSPFVGMNGLMNTPTDDAVDIVADGDLVYVARQYESYDGDDLYSRITVYNTANGVPAYVRSIDPLADNYGFDRIARIGNTLWAGFHEHESTILGVDGFDISNSAVSPPRVGAALANIPFGTFTNISAMTAIGSRLLVSYRHDYSSGPNDWLRAVDVSVPASPAWQNPVNLDAEAGTMSSVGNLLRISIKHSRVETWDTSNQAALNFLGSYLDTYAQIGQISSVSGTDYVAGGRGGLMTINTTIPASQSLRSPAIAPLPVGPSVVRQRGNTTVVLDYTLNALRLYDYTLPEAQQHRASLQLPFNSALLELGEGSGGFQLACVATQFRAGGDVFTIIDITNPASPQVRSTVPLTRPNLLSISSSRMYVFNILHELVIYELAQPLSPQLRSTTPFGGMESNYTCMTSWSNNSVALGTGPFGLWLINTANATAPFVSDIWTAGTGYSVKALAKGPNWLYVSSSIASPTIPGSRETRLETLNVANIANVTQRFVANSAFGAGPQPEFNNLAYVAAPAGKFLIGMQDTFDFFSSGSGVNSSMTIYELPPGGLTQEAVPYPISTVTLPFARGNVGINGDGSRIMVAGQQAGLYQVATPVQWAPGYGIRPLYQYSCYGRTYASFSAFASGNPASITQQWFRDGVPLVNGPTPWGSTIAGATEGALFIYSPRREDARTAANGYHTYRCVSTNSCGSTTTDYMFLSVCLADINCDGHLLPDDVAAFVSIWFASLPDATLAGDFDGNGVVEPADVSLFVTSWFTALVNGC